MASVRHDALPQFKPDLGKHASTFARKEAPEAWLTAMEECIKLSQAHDIACLADLSMPRMVLSMGRYSHEGLQDALRKLKLATEPFTVELPAPSMSALGVAGQLVRVNGLAVMHNGRISQVHVLSIHPSALAYSRARPIARFMSFIALDLALNCMMGLAGKPPAADKSALFSSKALPVPGAAIFKSPGFAITALIQAEKLADASMWTAATLPRQLLAWMVVQGVTIAQVDTAAERAQATGLEGGLDGGMRRSWLSVAWGLVQSAIQQRRPEDERSAAACQSAVTLGPEGTRIAHEKRMLTALQNDRVRTGWAGGGKRGGKIVSQLRLARGDMPHQDPRVAPSFLAAQARGGKNLRGRQEVFLATFGPGRDPLVRVTAVFLPAEIPGGIRPGRAGQVMEAEDVDRVVAMVTNSLRSSTTYEGCGLQFEVWYCSVKQLFYMRRTHRRQLDDAVILSAATKSLRDCPLCGGAFLSIGARVASPACRPVQACGSVVICSKDAPDRIQWRNLPALAIPGMSSVYQHHPEPRNGDKAFVVDVGLQTEARAHRRMLGLT